MTRDYAEFGRKGELEPIGVVDIGSNSVRLVIYEGAVRSPTPIFNEKVLCGLGRQLASTGHLGEEAVERALRISLSGVCTGGAGTGTAGAVAGGVQL